VTVAKAYRLLKAILNTAVDDGLIRRNPCRIKGAGQEKSAERPVLTVPQVYALAGATDERYRVLVLLAAFTSLRWGELAAHIMTYARPGDDGLIFTSPGSGPLSGYDGSIGPTITGPSHAQAHQLPAPVLGACPGGGRAPGDALSRPAPYREHARGRRGR
jgi:hypothetical protein